MEYAEATALIGAKNTGKTTYVIACVNAYLQADQGRRVLIIDTTLSSPQYAAFDQMEAKDLLRWKKGIKRLIVPFDGLDTILAIIRANEINNLMIVVEDAAKYLDDKVSKEMTIYLRDVKNKGRETFFLFHSFMDMPKSLFKMVNNLVVKKSEGTVSDIKSRTARYEVIEAFKAVNEHPNRYHHKAIKIN